MAAIYAEKTGMTVAKWKELMAADGVGTYLTGDQAKEMKLVDSVSAELKVAALATVDISAHSKAPAALKAQIEADKITAKDQSIQGAVAGHTAKLKAFHADASKAFGKQAEGHVADADKAKKDGLPELEGIHKALALSAEARMHGHDAMASDEEARHVTAKAAHTVAAEALKGFPHTSPLAKHHDAMADYHAVMSGEQPKQAMPAPDFESKLRETITAELKPKVRDEVTAELKIAAEKAKAPSDVRAEFKLMVETFGEAKAAKYFSKGVSMEEAKASFISELQAENGQLRKEKGEIETRLQEVLKTPSIKFDPSGDDKGGDPTVELTDGEMANAKELAAHTKVKDVNLDTIIAGMKAEKAKKAKRE